MRYVPNEANVFVDTFFNYSGAIFATTFRHPMERWYSQYRFDYLEGRYVKSQDRQSQNKKSFLEWYREYKNWFTCQNVFINTFVGQVRQGYLDIVLASTLIVSCSI